MEPSIDFATGRGLDKSGLRIWHGQMALLALTDSLAGEPLFWVQVDQVRSGIDPPTVARPYGTGQRRLLIAHLLITAAAAADRKRAGIALLRVGVQAHFVPEGLMASRSTYALRPDFLTLLSEAGPAAARRGVGRCLACGKTLRSRSRTKGGPTGKDERVDCCDDHQDRSDYYDSRLKKFYPHAIAGIPRPALEDRVAFGTEALVERSHGA